MEVVGTWNLTVFRIDSDSDTLTSLPGFPPQSMNRPPFVSGYLELEADWHYKFVVDKLRPRNIPKDGMIYISGTYDLPDPTHLRLVGQTLRGDDSRLSGTINTVTGKIDD